MVEALTTDEQTLRITNDAGEFYEMSRGDWIRAASIACGQRDGERRQFAAMVMEGLYTHYGLPTGSERDAYEADGSGTTARKRRAEEAVKAADALHAELEKTR